MDLSKRVILIPPIFISLRRLEKDSGRTGDVLPSLHYVAVPAMPPEGGSQPLRAALSSALIGWVTQTFGIPAAFIALGYPVNQTGGLDFWRSVAVS
jgi:hypothetical protein